ncbi:plant transposon protein [Nitzschia inconspicua]|uniref:Plant transposon protein n=1 Tax=Nitzschia inconspicua TaxID=303405 RepID=A0A9K3KWY8_9STRA|nr:plant transposon protein [Nitzschia inconspicua]
MEQEDEHRIDHRTLPQNPRRTFGHQLALEAIQRNFLQPVSPLLGKEFPLMFRISRGRFQVLLEDVMNTPELVFYHKSPGPFGRPIASVQAILLLPLKTLAYGVPPHTFIDFFQMSKEMARDCCRAFDRAIQTLDMKEYLRVPTVEDLKGINKLHQHRHGVLQMTGSLDCSHTYWKNCPKAWQGSYIGKEKKAAIVMEAVCDYHLWIWHVSYGYAGSLIDLNILNASTFLQAMTGGDLDKLEEEAGIVPYTISAEEFRKMFIIVDGIYPEYSRFVKGINQPVGSQQKHYTEWQEGARKDVEILFGVMQSMWQFIARRDSRAAYMLAQHLEEDYNGGSHVDQPNDLEEVQDTHIPKKNLVNVPNDIHTSQSLMDDTIAFLYHYANVWLH